MHTDIISGNKLYIQLCGPNPTQPLILSLPKSRCVQVLKVARQAQLPLNVPQLLALLVSIMHSLLSRAQLLAPVVLPPLALQPMSALLSLV